MIKYLLVAGLNGRPSQELHFNDDINVITGPNGSGKTTLLKLIWYLISGNIERIPREMYFDEIVLKTDTSEIAIVKTDQSAPDGDALYTFKWSAVGNKSEFEVTLDHIAREVPQVYEVNHALARLGGSLFFSTFRRLEGGFSMTPPKYMGSSAGRLSGAFLIPSTRSRAPRIQERMKYEDLVHGPSLQPTLSGLAARLSLYEHQFIASISTNDIVQLLTSKYAEVSEFTNRNHRELSDHIISVIRSYREATALRDAEQLAYAKSSLDEIAKEVERIDEANEKLLRPFSVLSDLIAKILRGSGVQITESIILGGKEKGIDSSLLSSGEKQMLSFLCYNAFSQEVPIFIDEPEISLHVDWQRILFPTLLSQGTGNQFIVATHSPFIYSKYEDKEMRLKLS